MQANWDLAWDTKYKELQVYIEKHENLRALGVSFVCFECNIAKLYFLFLRYSIIDNILTSTAQHIIL